ncbi:hypothetical protein RPHASCH2410_PC01205 (plasmid) [Rhizobium phaseoli Ch24-10]|nr:hypothetical protein RPHASCH2410_PC01205 [Rhizobium phaseoli Ch24-10]
MLLSAGHRRYEEMQPWRPFGMLLVDGKDVGSILISEGLAVPFVCGRKSCPPRPRPWCKA